MQEQAIAALAGAVAAAVGQAKNGLIAVIQSLVIGFLSAYFVGANVVLVLEKYFDFVVIYSAVYFLVALYGFTIYEKVRRVISTWHFLK